MSCSATASAPGPARVASKRLATDGSQGDLASGIYYSILFMMSMPFAITGTFAGLFYSAVKREHRRQNEAKAREASAANDLSAPTNSTLPAGR